MSDTRTRIEAALCRVGCPAHKSAVEKIDELIWEIEREAWNDGYDYGAGLKPTIPFH